MARSHRESFDVVVIGGGLIGCTIAWQLALRGLRIRVIERDSPAQAASWAAAGMLSPVGESVNGNPLREAADASFDLFPHFAEALSDATGIDPQFKRSGKLHLAFTPGDLEHMRDVFTRTAPGHATMLDAADVLRLEPEVSPGIVGGALVARDYHVDNRLLGRAAWLAAAGAGVQFTTGQAVAEIERDGGRVSGVRLATGESIAAATAVLAAGAWSGQVAGLPAPLPVEPVRGQMCAIELIPAPLTRMVQARGVYVVPRATGRVLVGATLERVGFRNEQTVHGVHSLLDAATDAVPVLRNAVLAEMWSGLRPGTADDLPVIGPDPDLPGLLHATGHYRNGILLAPITAEVICSLVIGQSPRVDLAPFAVSRFRV